MPNLPVIERERLFNVALRKGNAPQIAAGFSAEQPNVLPTYRELTENLAIETGVHPALVFGIMVAAITTFYLALTEQIKANESEKVH